MGGERRISEFTVGGVSYSLWRFTPTLCAPMPKDLPDAGSDGVPIWRCMLRLSRGYSVYVLRDGHECVGFATLRNAGSRYPFIKRGDVLLAPYFIDSGSRGRGLAKPMLTEAGKDHKGRVFALVLTDNTASVKTLSAIGYKDLGFVDTGGFIKRQTERPTRCKLWMHEGGKDAV